MLHGDPHWPAASGEGYFAFLQLATLQRVELSAAGGPEPASWGATAAVSADHHQMPDLHQTGVDSEGSVHDDLENTTGCL